MAYVKSQALYYPYIKVPKSSWFTRILLYWDEVGAIVPYEYIKDPHKLGSYMVGLVREKLVHQVMPGMYLSQAPNFDKAFLDFVDKSITILRSPKDKWPRVHMEKLQSLGEKLCDRGLARRSPKKEFSQWLKVERNTANAFMAYLAGVLGQIPEQTFCPVTDKPQWLAPFVDKHEQRKSPIRRIILREILPAPNRKIAAGRLADFKRKYQNELREFRGEVEDRVSELSLIEDEKSRKLRSKDVIVGLRGGVADLVTIMKEQPAWPKIDFGSICTVVGAGITAYEALVKQDYGSSLAGAALSVAPVVINAFGDSKKQLEGKPLAYAALASGELT